MLSNPILPAKYCADCILWKSKVVQIALAGLGIHPQNGQRDNFTHEPPCFDANVFGVPIIVKSSLTSGLFQTFAFTHHSSLMMPAWGLLQWKMTRKTLINVIFAKLEPVCSLTKKAVRHYLSRTSIFIRPL